MADSKDAGGGGTMALRPKVINFNILPAEYRQATLSRQETILVGIVVVGVILVFLLNSAHVELQSEISQTNGRLAQTNQRINQVRQQALPQVVQIRGQIADIQKRVQTSRSDQDALKARQLSWSTVLSKVFEALPPGVSVDGLSQGGGTVTVNGRGPDYAAPLVYAEKLRDSGLFTSVAFQVISEQPSNVPPAPSLSSTVPAGATPGGRAVTASPTAAAGVVTLPPTPTPVIATPTPVVLPGPVIQPTPTPFVNPSPTRTSTPGPSPTPSMTPTPSFTPTPRPTATPAVDYMVVSKGFTDFPNENNLNSTIRGRVIDPNNNPVTGARFRISSCCPSWSAEFPRDWEPASDGTFEFALTSRGTYTLEVLSGRSERVTDLSTGDFKGYRVWDVTFQKTSVGAPPPPIVTVTPTSTGTVTPTPTGTITPTPTGTRTATPSPTVSVTPTPTVSPTPTPTATPTRTSTPTTVPTAVVGNLSGDGQRPVEGGSYAWVASVRPVALTLPASKKSGSLPAAASPVSFVIILEVKAGP